MTRHLPFAIIALALLLCGCVSKPRQVAQQMSTAERDTNHFHWPKPTIELPRQFAAVVPEDEGATNFPADFPRVATFSYDVIPYAVSINANGTTNFACPFRDGLWRSFDGGKTKTVWVQFINDVPGSQPFTRSISLPCTGPNNQLVRVGTFAGAFR